MNNFLFGESQISFDIFFPKQKGERRKGHQKKSMITTELRGQTLKPKAFSPFPPYHHPQVKPITS